MGKLRLIEVQYFAKGHGADKQQNQDLNPEYLDSNPKPGLLSQATNTQFLSTK